MMTSMWEECKQESDTLKIIGSASSRSARTVRTVYDHVHGQYPAMAPSRLHKGLLLSQNLLGARNKFSTCVLTDTGHSCNQKPLNANAAASARSWMSVLTYAEATCIVRSYSV